MNQEPQSKNLEVNFKMVDEKEELSQGVALYVDLSNNEDKQSIHPIELMEEEIPLQNPKECEKNKNFENDKSLTIVKLTGIVSQSPNVVPNRKTIKNKTKNPQNIRKTKGRRGLKSSKCNVCRKGKELISCKKCPKSFHLACLQISQENLPKMFLCTKCKDKVRLQKKRYRQKAIKRKQTQTQGDSNIKAKPIITKTAIKSSEKAKDDKKKKFDDFSKKYPKYIIDGRIKFPIDDKLLQIYGSIFNESKSFVYKPSPKSCLIPSEFLGDILQITNFFHSFADVFQNSSFTKEELYTALNYNGDQVLEIINEIHIDLLSIVIKELFDKNKFEEFKENNPDLVSFLYLIKTVKDMRNFDDIFFHSWTEILNQLPNLSLKFEISEEGKELFQKLGLATYLNYNQLSKKEKIQILLSLIDIVYETDIFRECLDKRMEEYNSLYKEKNDLQIEIKQDENSLHEMEAQIRELENISSQIKNNSMGTSRQELLKKMKENENELKELSKLQANQTKMLQQIAKKKNRFEKIQKELPFFMNSMICLGQDVNKTEYWFLSAEDDKLFMRYPPSEKEDQVERWYILDTKEEIEQLVSALNTKGIKEKALHDNINLNIKHGLLKPIPELEKNQIENSSTSLKKNESSDKLSEILSTLFSNQNPSDIKLERNTRGRPKKNSSAEIKKSLTMELIIDMLIKNEIYFNNYLTQRSSRWMVEEERLKFVEKAIKNQKNLYIYLKISDLKYIVSIEKLAEALSIMNEDFSNIEYLFYDEEMSQPEENGSKDEENDEEMYYTLNKKHKKKIELENEANLSIKKINLRIWGFYNEKTRKSWIEYISGVDNLAGLYLASLVFCDFVSKYVSKKLMEMDSSNNNDKNKAQDKKIINLDNYKYVSNNEQFRAKQEKMNELLGSEDFGGNNTRRVTRKHLLIKNNKTSSEKEWEWDEDCKECGEYGDVLCCDTCPSVFHLRCVGLKEVPDGKWNCYECLQKLQMQRHTRAISKKYNIEEN